MSQCQCHSRTDPALTFLGTIPGRPGYPCFALLASTAGISGANFNPAVSVALGINKNMDWPEVGAYIGVQFAGAIAAGGAYFVLFGKGFALGPAKGFEANFGTSALVCELSLEGQDES